MLKSSTRSFHHRFQAQKVLSLGLFLVCGSLFASDLSEPVVGEYVTTTEINTGFEEGAASYQSVTLSIGWPSLLESKINTVSLPGGTISDTDEGAWSRESLQMGVIPEPRFLAVVVALFAGSILLAVRRRRQWAL